MRTIWKIIVLEFAVLIGGGLLWLVVARPAKPVLPPLPSSPAPMAGVPLRIGLIPERDIFAQRQRYLDLVGYLSGKLHRPVELVTVNSYETILTDMSAENARVDAAFLGALVAVVAKDRLDARVLVVPATADGPSRYRGVIIVREDSPIRTVEEAFKPERSMALVRMTMAGHLFPILLSSRNGGKAGVEPRFVWSGTHDDVAREVDAGRVDAGAIKDVRLDAWEREHGKKFRRLATSATAPDSALWVRSGLPAAEAAALADALLAMDRDSAGQKVLAGLGVARFARCECKDYEPVFAMIAELGDGWKRMGIAGRAPWCECAGTTRPDGGK